MRENGFGLASQYGFVRLIIGRTFGVLIHGQDGFPCLAYKLIRQFPGIKLLYPFWQFVLVKRAADKIAVF